MKERNLRDSRRRASPNRWLAIATLAWLVAAFGCNGTQQPPHDAGHADASHAPDATSSGGAGGSASDSGSSAGDASTGDGGVCTYDPNVPPRGDCPNDLPSACTDPAPSYANSVSKTIESVCAPCHRMGGLAAGFPFDTYARVYALRRTILDHVNRCIMPPACATQPTEAQRLELLQWLVCGAPQN